MVVQKQNLKRKWQNLFHLKCPNCNEKLEDSGQYLSCPTPHDTEADKSCFFIKRDRVAELLLQEDHPANFCLTDQEREKIDEMIKTELRIEDDADMA